MSSPSAAPSDGDDAVQGEPAPVVWAVVGLITVLVLLSILAACVWGGWRCYYAFSGDNDDSDSDDCCDRCNDEDGLELDLRGSWTHGASLAAADTLAEFFRPPKDDLEGGPRARKRRTTGSSSSCRWCSGLLGSAATDPGWGSGSGGTGGSGVDDGGHSSLGGSERPSVAVGRRVNELVDVAYVLPPGSLTVALEPAAVGHSGQVHRGVFRRRPSAALLRGAPRRSTAWLGADSAAGLRGGRLEGPDGDQAAAVAVKMSFVQAAASGEVFDLLHEASILSQLSACGRVVSLVGVCADGAVLKLVTLWCQRTLPAHMTACRSKAEGEAEGAGEKSAGEKSAGYEAGVAGGGGLLGPGEAFRLCGQLLEGVAYLHRRGIAHCRLAPAHCLLQQRLGDGGDAVVWDLKLCDLGGAQLMRKPRAAGGAGDWDRQRDHSGGCHSGDVPGAPSAPPGHGANGSLGHGSLPHGAPGQGWLGGDLAFVAPEARAGARGARAGAAGSGGQSGGQPLDLAAADVFSCGALLWCLWHASPDYPPDAGGGSAPPSPPPFAAPPCAAPPCAAPPFAAPPFAAPPCAAPPFAAVARAPGVVAALQASMVAPLVAAPLVASPAGGGMVPEAVPPAMPAALTARPSAARALRTLVAAVRTPSTTQGPAAAPSTALSTAPRVPPSTAPSTAPRMPPGASAGSQARSPLRFATEPAAEPATRTTRDPALCSDCDVQLAI